MSRIKPEPKPVYPIFHEAHDSLQNALTKAGLLLTLIETCLPHDGALQKPAVLEKIRESCADLRKALYGEQ